MIKTCIIQDKLSFLDEAIRKHKINGDILYLRPFKQFLHVFQIQDFREPNKIKYRIENLLIMIFFAKMAGEGAHCTQMARYIKIKKKMLFSYGILEKDENGEILCPSHDCFLYFLRHLDKKYIEDALIDRLKNFLDSIHELNSNKVQYIQYAIDGQEFRGTGKSKNSKNPKSNFATLNIFDTSTYVCMYSNAIEKKDSELKEAKRLLSYMNLKNRIITADALYTNIPFATKVIERNGNYVLRVKDKTTELYKEIESKFLNKKNLDRIDYENENGKYTMISLPKNYCGSDYPNANTYIKKISKSGSNVNEVLYFISSLKNTQAIYEATENRWMIENGLHKMKDDLFQQDCCRIHDKNAVENIATINNVLVAFIKIAQCVFQIKEPIEVKTRFKLEPMEYLQKLVSLISTNQLKKLIEQKMVEKNK